MNTSPIATSQYTLATLEDTPRRALDLLRGIGSSPTILRLMTEVGYTARAHEEGQRLLADVVGFVQERQAFTIDTSAAHMAVMNELDQWSKTVFRRLRAGAARFFPEEAKALFVGLEVSEEMDAALLAKIFLDRLDAVDDAETSTKAQKNMLRMFAQRGFGADEVIHLKSLVEKTHSPSEPPKETPAVGDEADAATKRETRLQMMIALRAWYDDWSETARTVLARRDHQIRVGLAHRKRPSDSKPPPPDASPSSPAVVPSPTPLPAPVD